MNISICRVTQRVSLFRYKKKKIERKICLFIYLLSHSVLSNLIVKYIDSGISFEFETEICFSN